MYSLPSLETWEHVFESLLAMSTCLDVLLFSIKWIFIKELRADQLVRRLQCVSASTSGHLQGASVVLHRIIDLCKIGVSLIVLYYATCPVSVLKLLKLLKLFCIVTIAYNNVVFAHQLSQSNPLYSGLGRNLWRYFVVTCKMLWLALFSSCVPPVGYLACSENAPIKHC